MEASYEELSVEERWSHGGPWMSIETCSIHLNYLLTNNQYPLVAEINGRIVGELELYIGEEIYEKSSINELNHQIKGKHVVLAKILQTTPT